MLGQFLVYIQDSLYMDLFNAYCMAIRCLVLQLFPKVMNMMISLTQSTLRSSG